MRAHTHAQTMVPEHIFFQSCTAFVLAAVDAGSTSVGVDETPADCILRIWAAGTPWSSGTAADIVDRERQRLAEVGIRIVYRQDGLSKLQSEIRLIPV